MVTFEKFREDIFEALNNKPSEWRDGQFVFNYIDYTYNVARKVQFMDKIDCFYDDKAIDGFIKASYNRLLIS